MASENVVNVSDATFQAEVLENPQPVLVDFWATWCGPCVALAPTVENIARDHAGKIKVCKVDVDGNPEMAAKFGIRSVPTLILFKNGQPQGQVVGNVPKITIENLLKKSA